MKLRVVTYRTQTYILCPNGSKLKADKDNLNRLLSDFRKPSSFKGEDGYWNDAVASMDEAAGETLAFVDDSLKLVIISDKLYAAVSTNYISATEYARKHGKGRAMVKRLCDEGRIEGAHKISSGWLIPEDAPYPERKLRSASKKEEADDEQFYSDTVLY